MCIWRIGFVARAEDVSAKRESARNDVVGEAVEVDHGEAGRGTLRQVSATAGLRARSGAEPHLNESRLADETPTSLPDADWETRRRSTKLSRLALGEQLLIFGPPVS